MVFKKLERSAFSSRQKMAILTAAIYWRVDSEMVRLGTASEKLLLNRLRLVD